MTYDSTEDTLKHIALVQDGLNYFYVRLQRRAIEHDESKLQEPEKSLYDEWTPRLRAMIYGSDEYKAGLARMGPALQHHYEHNNHHPEHYPDGIAGMSLLDLVEMFCDWRVASMRHADGDFGMSLEINRKRFGINPQLAAILENTRKELGW